jgi:hypothetical protein
MRIGVLKGLIEDAILPFAFVFLSVLVGSQRRSSLALEKPTPPWRSAT